MGADQQAAVVTGSKLLLWPRLMPGFIYYGNDFADNGYGGGYGYGFGFGNGYGYGYGYGDGDGGTE